MDYSKLPMASDTAAKHLNGDIKITGIYVGRQKASENFFASFFLALHNGDFLSMSWNSEGDKPYFGYLSGDSGFSPLRDTQGLSGEEGYRFYDLIEIDNGKVVVNRNRGIAVPVVNIIENGLLIKKESPTPKKTKTKEPTGKKRGRPKKQ